MKCPKCGREIEDGSLFCKYCFADIRIVPTYDSKVEQEINETMDQVKDDVDLETYKEERTQKKLAEAKQREKKTRLIVVNVVLALAAVCLILGLVYLHERRSPAYYLGQAYTLAEAGNYSAAADMITKAQQLDEDSSPKLMLEKAEYLEKAGRREEALATAKLVIEGSDPDSEDTINAYGRMIDIYAQDGEYDTINDIVGSSGNDKVKQVYSQYLVYEPVIQPQSGTYDKAVQVTITCDGGGSIFYTMDRSVPSKSSLLYSDPIDLSEGTYTIRAIAVNPFGLASKVVTRTYRIAED